MNFNEQIAELEKAKNEWQKKRISLMSQEATAIGNELHQVEQNLAKAEEKIAKIDEEIRLLKEKIAEITQEKAKPLQIEHNSFALSPSFSRKSKEKEKIDLFLDMSKELLDSNVEDYKKYLKLKDEIAEIFQHLNIKEDRLIDGNLEYKNEYIDNLVDKIIFKESLTKEEEQAIQSIRTEYKEDKKRFAWHERSQMINALVLSLAHGKFDVKKASLLFDFLTESEIETEQENWQRALVGLVLVLCKYHNKISKYQHFIIRLKELRHLPKIQDALVKINDILRNEFYKENKEFDFSKISFFEKPQNWFLPFHKDHELFKKAVENAEDGIDIEFLEKYLESKVLSNADKYALCWLIEKGSIKEFPPKSEGEKEKWGKVNRELIALSYHFFPFKQLINEWYCFFSSFSQQKFNNLLTEKIAIYNTKLTDIILNESNQCKFSAAQDFENKRWERAVSNLEKVLQINPSDIQALFDSAVCRTELKHFPDAIKYWEKLAELQPENPMFTVNIAICHYHLENYKKTLKILVKEQKPLLENNKQVLKLIGYSYHETKEYEKAIPFFKDWELMDQDSILAKEMLATCYFNLENHQEELNYRLKLNELVPNNFDYLDRICDAYYNLKDYVNAEKYALLAEKIDRNKPLTNLAWTYLRLQNFAKAEQYVVHSLKVAPNESHTLSDSAQLYFVLGKLAQAKEWTNKALTIENDDSFAKFTLICVAYCEGKKEEALADLQALRKIVNATEVGKHNFFKRFGEMQAAFEKNGICKEEFEELCEKIAKE